MLTDMCKITADGVQIRLVAKSPQPFVWLETSYTEGQWDKNFVLLLEEETDFVWQTKEKITCPDFLSSIDYYFPYQVRLSKPEVALGWNFSGIPNPI